MLRDAHAKLQEQCVMLLQFPSPIGQGLRRCLSTRTIRKSLRQGVRRQLASHVHYGNKNRTREQNLAGATV